MNREIKFRAISYLTDEWIQGYLSKRESLFFIQNTYSVKERTISQFTGFFDKKGNEIFEGDIVLFMGKNYRIKYFDKWGMFGLVGKSAYKTFNEDDPLGSGGSSTKYKPYCLGEYYQKRIEVVGNFYENPELC